MNVDKFFELNKQFNSSKDNKSFLDYFFAGVILVLLFVFFLIPVLIYSIWANAIVVKALWAWFVVKTFPELSLPLLTASQAWGISIFVAYLTHIHVVWKAKDERSSVEKTTEFVMLLIRPWFALGVGYVCAHYFLHVV